MRLKLTCSLSAITIALLLAGCGSSSGGGSSASSGSSTTPTVDDGEKVWEFEKIIDLSDNGGLTSNRISVIVDKEESPHFYYYQGNTIDGYSITHQQWDKEANALSSAENIITNNTASLDNTAGFALAENDGNLYSAYQGGNFRDCNHDVMSDAMFSVSDGSNWVEYTGGIGFVERNPALSDGFAGADLSMAVDSDGGVHLSYQFFYEGCDSFNSNYPDLLYVYKPANTFEDTADEQTVEGSDLEINNAQNDIGHFNQLILDVNEQPVVFYAATLAETDLPEGLRFSYQVDGEWVNEWVEEGCDVQGISAALTPDGLLAVAYYVATCDQFKSDDFRHGVRYAVQSESGWAISMVEETVLAGQYLSLAFDADGQPAVAYRSLESYSGKAINDLKLARYNHDGKSGWSREQVFGAGDIGWYNTLWFDQAGTTNVVSYSNSEQIVYWFTKEN